MKVFLVGVARVGKTTIGAKLADMWDCDFFDLDEEIERFLSLGIAIFFEPVEQCVLTTGCS